MKHHGIRFGLLLAAGALFAVPPLAAQQDKGTIAGIVFDPTGAVIPNAKVTLRNTDTGQARTATTGAGGEYVFTPLEVGHYELKVEAAGFQTEVRRSLELNLQQRLDVNFNLRLGATGDVVEVKDTAPALQTSDSSLGQVINTEKIINLPLNGRNVYSLVYLSPGVVVAPDGRASLTGQPSQQQGYVLDGVDNNNYQGTLASGGAFNIAPPPDAVEEFKVQTNNYSAEFGQAGGGVVNVITKSGTSQYHGSAYEFFRNEKLDARNFFATGKPPYKQNQFGGSFGGPVIIPKVYNGRDKSFFFADFEGFRSRTAAIRNNSLPSMPWRQGDFRDLLTGEAFSDPCTGASYDTGQLFDPTTTRPVTCADGSQGFARDPISYGGQVNVLDPNKIVAAASNSVKLLPEPNSGPFEYRWSPGIKSATNKFDVKFDQLWGGKDRLTWRYAFADNPPRGAPNFPGPASPGSLFTSRQQGGTFAETHTFSPRIINEFRYGYTRNYSQDQLAETTLNPNEIGFGGLTYERGVLGGLPSLGFSDVGGFGSNTWSPNIQISHSSMFTDTLSLIRGSHTFKLGGSYNRYGFNQLLSAAPMGQYDFSGILTADLNASSVSGAAGYGSGFAQFLFGIPDFSSLSYAFLSDNLRQTGALFIQDDWKVTPKLTVNLGLRWDLATPLYEKYDRVTGVDFKTSQWMMAASRRNQQPQLPAGTDVEWSDQRALMIADNNNLAPRVGLAYQLTPKTVIRSAFGVFYANTFPAGTMVFPLNPPWGATIYLSAPPTGPIDPTTGQRLPKLVTNISEGFPPGVLFNEADRSLLYLSEWQPLFPYTLNWNLAVQRNLGFNTVLEVAYAGTQGSKIVTGSDDNQPYPSADPDSDPQTRRPYPNMGTFGVVHDNGKSHYNSLQLKLEKRYSNGLSFLASHTWAHSMDSAPLCVVLGNSGSGGDCYRDSHNLAIDMGNSSFDVRHRFVLSWMYELPFGQGRPIASGWHGPVQTVLGGWKVGGIESAQTGYHFTPVSSYDPANSPTYQGGARAQALGNPSDFSYGQDAQQKKGCPVGHSSVECFFNPAAFGLAAPGTFGNAGRNVLEGPGRISMDFTVFKEFRLAEGKHVEYRTEFFNILNRANFNNPTNAVDSRRFSRITSAGSPRSIQLALRILF